MVLPVTAKNLLPQFLQPPEIVVLYIPSGLVQFHCDLFKSVAVEQMKPQGLALDLREDSKHLAQSNPSEHFLNRAFVSSGCRPQTAQFISNILQIDLGIEMARVQIAATVNRTMVGHLHDPRTCRTLGTIKYRALLVNEQKYVLEQIVRF